MDSYNWIEFEYIYTVNQKVLDACSPPGKIGDSVWSNVRGRYYPLKELKEILDKMNLPSDYCQQIKEHLICHKALKLEKEEAELLNSEDFTIFRMRSFQMLSTQLGEEGKPICEEDELERFLQFGGTSQENFSYDCTIWLWCPDVKNELGSNAPVRAAYGRALVCLCRKGETWSITFRGKDGYPKPLVKQKYLNKTRQISDELSKLIFPTDPNQARKEEHGLIVISGRTGAAKSKIASELFDPYLSRHSGGERKPHLLTYEDPIEQYLDEIDEKDEEKEPQKQRDNWKERDYTSREKGKDAANLGEVVNNALRQTPKVLFIGETRAQEDWRKLLEFAGTGHLVVTTTHAGSLTETMSNLLRATEAKTPTERSELANRILALIHVRGEKVELKANASGEQQAEVLTAIPALWRRTPGGVKALMAEGLSALLPHNPKEDPSASYSSIGRLWFARKLVKKRQPELSEAQELELENKVIKSALKWDLEEI